MKEKNLNKYGEDGKIGVIGRVHINNPLMSCRCLFRKRSLKRREMKQILVELAK